VRLIRIVKLYKSANTAISKAEENDEFVQLARKQTERRLQMEKEAEE